MKSKITYGLVTDMSVGKGSWNAYLTTLVCSPKHRVKGEN